ncbi:GtrA family protein [Microbacterium sp. M28]|uniref:GtrA family protein n=1 Tax=Microbacterium sp. M28 TaxID=2962064 RepID=UPI0021F3EF60|nr:GtrA family protein [Microbacterium sp. M28]UYO98175.1 GtrA family protein [Microbacterium sp. M28]
MPIRLRDAAHRLWSRSAVRYLLVGGFCFVVDVALLWIAHELLGIPLSIATPVAFLVSFAVTYTMQRVVAFASDSHVVPSVARYTALVAFNTVATTGIVWLVDQSGAGWFAGKVLAVVATTIWNYFAYRYWVFVSPSTRSTDV